ncbi:hypothetical protein [Enterobacter sp. A103]|uniref:hypothetical protein n=1 Tax=Enterobacter sp. A103 TaxID=3102785 RepID=UPI002ACA8D54|nr:hypothetical protein [Enterobacter sp. A103]MDZ5638995.1 hypothetical protein [Enterobacter sp. A103]
MDESRKAFEQNLMDEFGYPKERIEYWRGKEDYSANEFLSARWKLWSKAWQASRAAIEIKLPQAELVYSTATDTYGEDGCLMLPVETISRVLDDAGIKVKE